MDKVDVIQWFADPSDPSGQSSVHDSISVNGVLFEDPENQLRNALTLDSVDNKFKFTTKRVLDTKGPLDAAIELDQVLSLSIATGSSGTKWEQRTDIGNLGLYLPGEPGGISTTEDARIAAYEAHGWICFVAWFPLGFALLATQRYYKAHW